MNDKVNRTHKNVIGYMNGNKYKIVFSEYIFDNWRDGDEMEKIIQRLLKPRKYFGFYGWDDQHGSFIKDNIRVYTWWTNMLDYFWEVHTNDENVQNKVYEWAAIVYDEYKKIENKSDSE
ncbi:MAG: hypothetical protein K2N72_06355 [Oscillospiraceae bacterium]|nr:hypothetical protein [Oscillospiraceae bacterium]